MPNRSIFISNRPAITFLSIPRSTHRSIGVCGPFPISFRQMHQTSPIRSFDLATRNIQTGIPPSWDGRCRVSGKLMRDTNSIERADALRKLVEKSCQGLLQHRLREHSDPTGPISNREARPRLPTEPPPAEMDAIIRQYKANLYARWVDEPVPAPGGKTPRQASGSTAGRE